VADIIGNYSLTDEKKLASVDKKILSALSQGKLISGELIGNKVGTSRAYVWKRINSLKEQGLKVISIHGEGYRLPAGEELLDAQIIHDHLGHKATQLRVCWSLPSTNLAAMELAEHAPQQEFVVLAEMQTQGRGRRGKEWFSPLGADLYMSYKIPFSGGAKSLQGLSLVIGVAISNALKKLTAKEGLSLKWPNDIYFQGRKLGGILIEMCGDINGDCDAIIGVGLNASYRADESSSEEVASLTELMPGTLNRNYWVAMLINAIKNAVTDFKKNGLSEFLNQWRSLDILVGNSINVFLGESVVTGIAEGVSPSGALLVQTGEGLKTFYAGEVSVRKQ